MNAEYMKLMNGTIHTKWLPPEAALPVKVKQNPVKLRINGIDDEITPSELKKMFKKFGKVQEVAIYSGKNVDYAIITMPETNALRAKSGASKLRWKENWLGARIANRSRGPWLSPTWRPPQQYWYR
jgi:hypothetical protein